MLDGSELGLAGDGTASDATVCLASAAERLRSVRAAQARFLALWAVDHMLADPPATARARADVSRAADVTPDNPWANATGRPRNFSRVRFVD
jgi:hypothetical protein